MGVEENMNVYFYKIELKTCAGRCSVGVKYRVCNKTPVD